MTGYTNGYGKQRPSFGAPLKGFFKQNTVMKWLFIINVGLWVTVFFANTFLWLYKSQSPNPLLAWLSLPADLSALAQRPWTPITYMILHEKFWHLFLNMMMLWIGGMVFVKHLSQKHLVLAYGLGGLIGAVFYVVAYNIFPVFETMKSTSVALGASASVLAILVAAITFKPDYGYRFFLFGQLKFKWLVLIFVVIDLLSISPEDPGVHIVHLGGLAFGIVYGLLLRKGLGQPTESKRKKRGPKVEYTPYEEIHDEPEVQRSDEEYNRKKAETERDIDAILDKIAQSGYGSLTAEEKEFLFKNSK